MSATEAAPAAAAAAPAPEASPAAAPAPEASPAAAAAQTPKEVITDLRDPMVLEKYQKAGEIVQKALKLVISQAKPGEKISVLCQNADALITSSTALLYNKSAKKVEKGIAFPTCISPNNIVGNFSPLLSNSAILKAGDIVKIDLGVHIDGYVAVGGHTFLVQPVAQEGQEPVQKSVSGPFADVVAAVHTALDAAQRVVKAGNKNSQVTEIIGKVAADFGVTAVQGVLSHQLKRFVIDGEKVILNRAETDNKVDEFVFEPNEVYAIDVAFSTGEGKPKEVDERTTIYKKNPGTSYMLKGQQARAVFAEINKKFATFPFSIRDFESEAKAKMAMRECAQHNLVSPYPVLLEKEGVLVAQAKATFLITDKGTVKLTGLTFDNKIFHTAHKVVDPDVRATLNQSTSLDGANKKKKKKAAAKDDKEDKKEAEAPAAAQ